MKILLAEDDVFFQNFYSKKLAEKGYTVYVARDGKEALNQMTKNMPDLILLDLIMPNMDGFEVLTEKAKHPEAKDIPVLVFSTLGQTDDIEKAKKLGATEYVNKTFFDFENLVTKINATVKR